MKRKKDRAPVTTGPSGSRRARPSLNVNRVRHVFSGKRPAGVAAVSRKGESSVAVRSQPANSPKARAIRTLKKKAAGSIKKGGKQTAVDDGLHLDATALAQEKKVYRALKKLHIDFKPGASAPSVAGTRNIKKKSAESIDASPGASEAVEASKVLTLGEVTTPTGRKRQEGTLSEETAHSSKPSPVQIGTAIKRTVKSSSRPGSASRAVSGEESTADRSYTRLKKSITKPKSGLHTQLSPSCGDSDTGGSTVGTKTGRTPVNSPDTPTAGMLSILPKTSKRFSTSIYSSRRKSNPDTSTSQPETKTEPTDVHEGFQRGRPIGRGSFRARTIPHTATHSKGRGFAVAPLSSRGTAKLVYRDRGRRVSASDVDSAPDEDTNVENVSEHDEPPAKRGRFKKVPSASAAGVDGEKDGDQTAEGRSQPSSEASQAKNKPSIQTPVARNTNLTRRKSSAAGIVLDTEGAAASKEKTTTPKTSKNKPAVKGSSRSVESVVRDRGSVLGQIKTAAHSRSSSPGGTDVRSRNKTVAPKAGDLSRSSSLDNLLYKSQSPPVLKQTRSNKGGTPTSSGSAGKPLDSTVNPKSGSASDVSCAAFTKMFYSSLRRKRSVSPGKGGAALKKRRLLSRLQDSSTHQMPDILLSGRSARQTALGDSPAVSRESSPGTLPRSKGKRSVEMVSTRAENSERQSQGKDQFSETSTASTNVPADPQQQSATSGPGSGQSAGPRVVGVRRGGPGRPKGSPNKRFRLNRVKQHVAKETPNVQRSTPGRRGPGRPRKISPSGDRSQSVQESDSEMNNPSGSSTWDTNSVTDSKSVGQKGRRRRPPLNASQSQRSPATQSSSRGNGDSLSKSERVSNRSYVNVDVDTEGGWVDTASKPAGKEKALSKGGRRNRSDRMSHRNKSNPLRTLVRMKRESRRQLKKSRWASGKLPKQSQAALSSSIRFRKQSSVSGASADSVDGCQEKGEASGKPATPLSSAPSGTVHTETETMVTVGGGSHSVLIPSRDPGAAAHDEHSYSCVSSRTVVPDHSPECEAEVGSLGDRLPTEQSPQPATATPPAEGDQCVSEKSSVPAVGEPVLVQSETDASGGESAHACQPLSTAEPTAEDLTRVDPSPAQPFDGQQQADTAIPPTEASARDHEMEDKTGSGGEDSEQLYVQNQLEMSSKHYLPEEQSTCDETEHSMLSDQVQEEPICEVGQPTGEKSDQPMPHQAEQVLQDEGEETAMPEQAEEETTCAGAESSVSDPPEPPMHDQTEEPSLHSKTEPSLLDDTEPAKHKTEEPPIHDKTKEPPTHDKTESPMHDRTDEPSTCNQPKDPSVPEESDTMTDIISEGDGSQGKPDTSLQPHTSSTESSLSAQSQATTTDPSAATTQDSPDNVTMSVVDGETHTLTEIKASTGPGAKSPAQQVCEDDSMSNLEAVEPQKVKPEAEGQTTATLAQPQDVGEEAVSTTTSLETHESKLYLTSTDHDQTKESLSSRSASTTIHQTQKMECDDKADQPDMTKPEAESVKDFPRSSLSVAGPEGTKEEKQGAADEASAPDRQGQSVGEPAMDEKHRKHQVVPIAKRKQKAISRELKRLQTDEGAQRIMSWHEKKKLKTLGKLLRSKIKDDKQEAKETQQTKEPKPRSNKLYSIDTISDTRLVFKSGKTANSGSVAEPAQKKEWAHDGLGSLDKEDAVGFVQESGKSLNPGVLSASSSIDCEDPPPDITTEMSPYKDSRLERCRSEELSPPPLIRPEDLFSEKYYESMSGSQDAHCQDGKSASSEVFATVDIDSSQGNEASDTFSLCTTKLGPRKKRGRGRRKGGKMGPASKTGRELHVRPGPASSKFGGRRTSNSPKQDPPFIRNMPLLPSEPRTFALRPKTTRSPIEIIAMRQKLEEEAYELEEATRVARKLKRRQALFGKLAMASDTPNQNSVGSCKPCSVVLVDFVKELHLNSIDTSDQYISDVSYDSDEADVDEEDDDYIDDMYDCQPDDDGMVWQVDNSQLMALRRVQEDGAQESISGPDGGWKGSERCAERIRGTQPTPSASSSLPDVKKSAQDLESLRGKGFMGNFVDFIQNRSSHQHPIPPSKQRPRFRPKTMRSPGHSASVTSAVSVNAACTACTSDSVVTVTSLTTMSSSSCFVSVSSHSQVVTCTQVHTPRQGQLVKHDHRAVCQEDKTVSSSPSQTAESSTSEGGEKTQYSPPHHALVKSSSDKNSSPGKLKVFPVRKESDGVATDKTSFTRYLCTKCEFSATNKGTIESHIYRHIPGVTFKCAYCESEFTGLISALTHVKNSHHSKEPQVWISKDINEASLYTEEPVMASPHGCQQEPGPADGPEVGGQAGDSSLVQEAQPVIISLVVSGGDRSGQRPERFSSSPLATQRRFACTHCSYCTNVVEDAHQHVWDLHNDSSLFTCYLCDKAFGCSHQDIVTHCRTTHPDRPKSFKKLPDFYDQELIRMNTGTGERSKSSEDRGNIFDRMSNFFPSLGPGSELMEDGQLSPQARFLRARDYLYIQEGWSKKTSAEADSTTIEDIEIPFEDAAEMDSSGLVSTSEEQISQQQLVDVDEGALGSSTNTADRPDSAAPLLSENGAKTEVLPSSQTPSEDLSDTRHAEETQTHFNTIDSASGQTVASLDNQTSANRAEIGSAGGEYSQTIASKEVLKTTETATSTSAVSVEGQSKANSTFVEKDTQAVREGPVAGSRLAPASGRGDRTEGAGDRAGNSSTQPSSAGEGSSTTKHPGSSGDPMSQAVKVRPRSSAKTSAPEEGQGMGTRQQPAASEEDMECEDDGENDILVIDLGEDVLGEDLADDTSHCSSSPREETEAEAQTAEGGSRGKEATSQDSPGQEVPGIRGLQPPSAHPQQSAAIDAESGTARGTETADSTGDDDGMGIKILSVFSLRDKVDQAPDLYASPPKSQVRSKHSSPSPSSAGSKPSPARRSAPLTPKSSPGGSTRKKSTSASKQLVEVDADVIAARNERMVCTYKCHTCSIHSPALAAIVEHLKQHHLDVPLFSCPYCKTKKQSFFSEEKVHLHVSEHHPSNYAKNEVSLSEIAKSFVQVLALPSGNRVKGSLIEEDIYMCLQCESHVPDLDYALRHLKYEHPGLLKYACPICGMFSHSQQEVVKQHMQGVHGQTSDSVQLAMAMEGVYLTKVTCISVGGQYVDHSPLSPSRPSAPSSHLDAPPVSSPGSAVTSGAISSAPAQSSPLTLMGGVESSSSVGVGPFGVLPLPLSHISPLALTSVQEQPSLPSGPARTGKQRARPVGPSPGGVQTSPVSPQQLRSILPMPGPSPVSPQLARKRTDSGVPLFQTTGVTVKDILDTRQKTVEPVPSGSGAVCSETLPADTLTPRVVSSRVDWLGRSHSTASPCDVSPSSTHTAPPSTLPTPSRPVLRVPSVSTVLDLTSSSRCMSVDTGTSVNTLTARPATASPAVPSLANPSKHHPTLPFSLGTTLTAPTPTTGLPPDSQGSVSMPASPMDREDPEAFKIFNLKPRTPLSPGPSPSPAAVSTHKSPPSLLLSPPSPRTTPAANLTTSGAVTVASSALFPQQFRLQPFRPLQPAGITTLPLGQGGLPLAQNLTLPMGAGVALNPGLTIPLNVHQPQLLMAPTAFPPVLVPANLLQQLNLRAPVPQLPVVSGTAAAPPPPAPPPAHQPVSDVQTAPVNLSLAQPSRHALSSVSPRKPKPKTSSKYPASSASSFINFRLGEGISRGRGRPRLQQKSVEPSLKPRIPATASPRPSTPTPSTTPVMPQGGSVASISARRPETMSSPKPARPACQQCVCPYCPDTLILKPWEVAQHIKMSHPGKEVKYNRV
ncbi:uncharacterized protein LOC143302296 [Babylonia areolata]|uniref:uncharacterized protein LOC143302296 n=1 Tax=Babylonia areolata TaxID=304850 RepID=UPI003FCF021A